MFSKSSKPISKEEMSILESELNLVFPEEFMELYYEFNGGIPNKPFFYSEESDIEIEIQRFSPIKYTCKDSSTRTLEEKYLLFREKAEIMSQYLPFANDYGANQICIHLDSGKIYIVYMDVGEIKDECIVFLSDSMKAFIAGLSDQSVED